MLEKIYPGFSFRTHWISNFGSTKTRGYKVFNGVFVVFGIIGFLFTFKLWNLLPPSSFLIAFIVSMIVLYSSIILITFFPPDKKHHLHQIISGITMFGILGASIFSIPIILSSYLPTFLIPLNIVIAIDTIALTISVVILNRKYGDEIINLVKIINKEKSFFAKYGTLFEWTLSFLFILWMIIIWFY